MAAKLTDIALYTSTTNGGVINQGGAIGSRMLSQTHSPIVNILLGSTSIAIDDAAMNAEGVGTLLFTSAGQTLSWTAPGDTLPGSAVAIGVSGQYEIRGYGAQSGYLLVTVTAENLPFANATYTDSITIANSINALAEDFSKAEAAAGDTDYHCFYVKNNSAFTIASMKLWINAETQGADTLSLWAAAAKNTTAEVIANENTAPAGSTFTAPNNEISGIELGQLNAGDTYYVWMKRVLPITTARVARDISSLRFAALC